MTVTSTTAAPHDRTALDGAAARLIQDLTDYASCHAGQLPALCEAAAAEGWSGPQTSTCLALTAALTRTRALQWLLGELTARYGPAGADDLALRLSAHRAGEPEGGAPGSPPPACVTHDACDTR